MALPGKWTTEDIIALTYIKGLNYSQISKVVNSFKSLKELEQADQPVDIISKLNQASMFGNPLDEAKELAGKQVVLCEKNDVYPLTLWDEDYPGLLKQTAYPPVILYVKGRLQQADSTAISIVGTRQCTTYGKLTAERFAERFAANNLIVVSGLAYGIDTEAHMNVVKNGGITYAVIACGIDCIAPPIANKNADRIIESGGAVISEYRCGTKALPAYFPQRNRIISGISIATVVIESGRKGGALITAQFAFDQQREVFAIPGNISSEKSIGTNMLIKRNLAIPALSPEDVLMDLGLVAKDGKLNGREKTVNLFGDEEEKIYNALSYEPVQIDELAAATGLDISELLVKLLSLEFRNVVRQLPGKYYIRI